jgi:divalent metal cation (Fe/Co/Zn/Cd) transporter
LRDIISIPGSRGDAPTRAGLVAAALRLSWLTIGWNGVVGTAALGTAVATNSLVLAGFALNALLDSSASVVLVWRFRRERVDPAAAERLERRAQALIVAAMCAIALYVGVEAVRALADEAHADESPLAIVLAGTSLLVLPWLARAKLRVAASLSSPALRGDAILTLAAAALAAVTLLALIVTSALGWWWADPAAALLIAAALAWEATRVAVRHRFG